MNTVKNVLKSKRFWAATTLAGVALSVILIQRKAPKIEVLVEDELDDINDD